MRSGPRTAGQLHKADRGCKEGTYDVELTNLAAIGFNAMMHGYMPFDKDGKLLVPFRTLEKHHHGRGFRCAVWRSSISISNREWTILHLYQTILNGEEHVKGYRIRIYTCRVSALAADWREGSRCRRGIGMFPIDTATKDYNEQMGTEV